MYESWTDYMTEISQKIFKPLLLIQRDDLQMKG